MPRYDYECNDCKTIYQDTKLIAERDKSECEKCNSKNVRRIPAAPPFHLQGGGWTKQKKKTPAPSLERKVEDMSRGKKIVRA